MEEGGGEVVVLLNEAFDVVQKRPTILHCWWRIRKLGFKQNLMPGTDQLDAKDI